MTKSKLVMELTAGCVAAVDGRHPQVGGTSVEDDGERLRRGADGDHAIVGQLVGQTETHMSVLCNVSRR